MSLFRYSAIFCAAATICLMLGLTWGSAAISAWTSAQVLGIIAVGVLLLILFVFTERRANKPILPLDLFRRSIFRIGAALALLQSMVLLGLALYLPLFFQGVLGVSPTNAGLIMTPFSVSMVAGAVLGSMALNKLRRYRLVAVAGALIMSIGALMITLMTPAYNMGLIIGILVLTGIGIGPFFSLPMVAVQNELPASQLGISTAALRYLGQVGATLGIAIVGTVIASTVPGNLMGHLPTDAASKAALASALQHGFLAVLIFALLALCTTFFLKDMAIKELQARSEDQEEDQETSSSDKTLVQA